MVIFLTFLYKITRRWERLWQLCWNLPADSRYIPSQQIYKWCKFIYPFHSRYDVNKKLHFWLNTQDGFSRKKYKIPSIFNGIKRISLCCKCIKVHGCYENQKKGAAWLIFSPPAWTRIYKSLRSPGMDASLVACRAGTTNRGVVPARQVK